MQKLVNVDHLASKNVFLYDKNLNYLFEYFNSDKGEHYINQYEQPLKRKNNKILAHGYTKIYESLFKPIKDQNLKISIKFKRKSKHFYINLYGKRP